ncbi:hypothetical protein BDW75DRAFT_52564 [Aspergillus navahoensis]
MKNIILTAVCLAVATATPIAAPAPAPTTTTTTSTAKTPSVTTQAATSEATKQNIENLCLGLPLTNAQSSGVLPTSISGDSLSLGKLQQCASHILNDKPLAGLLGELGELFPQNREA